MVEEELLHILALVLVEIGAAVALVVEVDVIGVLSHIILAAEAHGQTEHVLGKVAVVSVLVVGNECFDLMKVNGAFPKQLFDRTVDIFNCHDRYLRLFLLCEISIARRI